MNVDLRLSQKRWSAPVSGIVEKNGSSTSTVASRATSSLCCIAAGCGGGSVRPLELIAAATRRTTRLPQRGFGIRKKAFTT
eukprot:CAMPEP_0206820360 /NCGR_PEP_ID=MMETSP0975-20121206/11778_1 /ASSEMBLY_ACC=CAM_ASM_000399 /TAXON_ID=483370 /ORGANISM="non described non described, Strain CCMP2097" /LENGTH=80 /DNA_ID=CAMNT_0054362601 /DNA_START=98 /DNA_END=336 /DNA_ORIENTATION=+